MSSDIHSVFRILHVFLHPFLQLLGDALVLPFRHVGDNHTGIERTSAGAYAQVLYGLLAVVQIAHVCILSRNRISMLLTNKSFVSEK